MSFMKELEASNCHLNKGSYAFELVDLSLLACVSSHTLLCQLFRYVLNEANLKNSHATFLDRKQACLSLNDSIASLPLCD